MKKPLHPAAFAAALAACVALLIGVFLRSGNAAATKSNAASPYTKIGERPESAGSGVNSLTGETLSETAKAYEASSFAQHAAPRSGAPHAGR